MRGRLSLIALIALLAAGCGGGGGGSSGSGTIPAGAAIAPASAPAFISINTDFASDQWTKATVLAKRFPSAPDLLAQLEQSLSKEQVDLNRDLKPALGPEVDVVFVDFANGGNDVVVLTQPRDKAKLDALLAKGSNPPARADIDGWTVLADSQAKIESFRKARTAGSLTNDQEFQDTMRKLPQDALARVYVAGVPVQSALDTAVTGQGAPPGTTKDFGTLSALALSATAQDNGVLLNGRLDGTLTNEPDSYKAELPSELPAGPLLFVSFHGLDKQLQQVISSVEKARPNFKTQLDQVQAVAGLTLENDVLPLFSGEGAVAVYPSTQALPTIELVLRVDEGKAQTVLDRIGTLAKVAGQTIQDVDISGVPAHELAIPGQPFSIIYAVFDGKLVVTNSRDGIAGLRSNGIRLDVDPLYRNAADLAGLPDETVGFTYADLRDGLPFVFGLAARRGSTIPDAARENVRPLDAAILFATKDGKAFHIGGFLTMK